MIFNLLTSPSEGVTIFAFSYLTEGTSQIQRVNGNFEEAEKFFFEGAQLGVFYKIKKFFEGGHNKI